MKVTDDMVVAALTEFEADWQNSDNADMGLRLMRRALTAALDTQPDRYREGFEKAREMAAELFEVFGKEPWRAGTHIALAIRNMEMPDEQ